MRAHAPRSGNAGGVAAESRASGRYEENHDWAQSVRKRQRGQTLKSFEVLVIARDASGKYVGAAIYGTFAERDSSGGFVNIEPGASGGGIVVSEIDYVDVPFVYEVAAIGILAEE